jgi:ATP-dependent DNA helicase PIF1
MSSSSQIEISNKFENISLSKDEIPDQIEGNPDEKEPGNEGSGIRRMTNSCKTTLEDLEIEGENKDEFSKKIDLDKYDIKNFPKDFPILYRLVFVENRNIYLSGLGGCGKSFLAKIIKAYGTFIGLRVAMTSTTGTSAYGIGGVTIHSWSGIRLADKPTDVIINYIKGNKQKLDNWKKTDILILDEVSMLGAKIVTLLDVIGKDVRLGKKEIKRFIGSQKDVPAFGGLQLIASGDMSQTPPVKDDFAFYSPVWNQLNFHTIRLTTPHRFPDINHFNMLARARDGKLTDEDITKLRTRVVAYEEYARKLKNGEIKESEIKPTRIYSLNRNVDALNAEELDKLDSDPVLYEACDTITVKRDEKSGEFLVNPKHIKSDEYMEYMENLAEKDMLLKVNAQVMLKINLDVDMGLTNGSRGIIEELFDEKIRIKFKNGLTVDIVAHPFEYEDNEVVCVRMQYPIKLAWAMTFHKAVGATLDYAILDLGTSLWSNLGYVGLSRCRTLEGLLITNLIPEKIKSHEDSVEFEKCLLENKPFIPKIENEEGDQQEKSKKIIRTAKVVKIGNIQE